MKRLFLLLILLAVIIGAGGAFILNRRVAGPLTGVPVSRAIANRRPVLVTIDNYVDARPQTGLAQASLVFETLTEGGITRFMAVYLEQGAPVVGPVRSTRLYFNHWAAGLDPIFAHDGGNVDSLQELPHLTTIYNEDADKIVGPFYRVSTRAVPHNEYTGTPRIRAYASLHGAASMASPMVIPHKADAPSVQRPHHFTLTIQFSSPDYAVTWQYDPMANDYRRFMGGVPHLDAATGKQLTAKNVVIMVTDETAAYDPFTPGAIHLRTEGTGHAVIFRDGSLVQGTWDKPSIDSPLRWLDSAGHPIPLDVGATWIEIIPKGTVVSESSS